MVQKEKQVKSYTRKSKSGKQVQVKSYSAKYDSAEDMVKEALKQKKGAGKELEALKKKKPVAKKEEEKSPYEEYGFTKDEFKEWYEGTGSKADKKVEKALKKAMGTKAYNAFSDKAADDYKKGGAHRFFTKGLEEMKASTSAIRQAFGSSKSSKEDAPKSSKSKTPKASAKKVLDEVSKEDAKTQEKESKRLNKKVASLEKKLRDLKYVHSGLKRDDPKKLKYAKKIQELQSDLIATKKASAHQDKVAYSGKDDTKSLLPLLKRKPPRKSVQ